MDHSRKIWVIGVGYLGQRLVAALRAQGHRVLGIDVRDSGDVQGDASDIDFLSSMSALYGLPEQVYLCQATSGGDAAAYVHSYHLVFAALVSLAPSARVISCSSSSVYARVDGSLVSEESLLPEQATDLAAILRLLEENVLACKGCVARLSALYGPNRSVLLPRYRSGVVPIAGPAQRYLNYVHVDDAVEALLLMSDLPAGVYNVSGESITKAELLEQLQQVTGLPIPSNEPRVSRRGGTNQRVDSRKLRGFSWQPERQLATFLAEEMYAHEG